MKALDASGELHRSWTGDSRRSGLTQPFRAPKSDTPAWTFALAIPEGTPRQVATGWLLLGLGSLAGAGMFAILLVLSRTPYVDRYFPWVDFFHTALVVHVDLSVLVWFLAFAGVFWNLNPVRYGQRWGWIALAMASAGALVMAGVPFVGAAQPLMSNYLPVLQDPLFLGGMVVFAAGVALQLTLSLCWARPIGTVVDGAGALRFGINVAAIAAAIALLSFALSYLGTPRFLDGRAYFERLFWGGGHVLQFVYAQLAIVAWLCLAASSGVRIPLSPRVVLILFIWGVLWLFLTPVAYLAYAPQSAEFHRFFLWLMAFGGSLAAGPIGLALAYGLATAAPAPRGQAPQRAALVGSVALFGIGGILGLLINGNNVVVPAHYHGCIVGVTLAFMGMTYELLPRLEFRTPALRTAVWQLYLYAGGELLHVVGLAWAGGYGVSRKVAGAAQALHGWQENAAMALMGIGGLVAVAGGVLFVIVCLRALFGPRTEARHFLALTKFATLRAYVPRSGRAASAFDDRDQ